VKPLDLTLIAAGAATAVLLALGSQLAHGAGFVAGLEAKSAETLNGSGVGASFQDSRGWLTRHPTLRGGELLPDGQRALLAIAVADLPGIGGVRWAARPKPAATAAKPVALHCQADVNAVLGARSLRFAEASAEIDPASIALLDEVAAALKPCTGSVIAIIGHTDAAGDEPANVALSQQRADAVRVALIARGLAPNGLRARGLGSQQPLADLEPADPANRRIDFEVITIRSVQPTPIDTPGAG
jgi:OOP family OmpA-OmpF porin